MQRALCMGWGYGTVVVGYVNALKKVRPPCVLESRRRCVARRSWWWSRSESGRVALDGDAAVAIKQALVAVQQELTADHVPFHIRNLGAATPAEDIVAIVEEYDADLRAVIGIRRRTTVGKFLLGTRHSRC